MELYDEQLEQKKSKMPMIIGISITVLVVITLLIIFGIIYIKNSITIIKIDGERNIAIEELFYFESTENGLQLYMPIIKTAKFLKYEGFTGDYKNKSEDKTKCHVVGSNEIAMFTLNSDILVKITGNSEYEYIKLDKTVFEKNGELYTTIDGIQNAFNVKFISDQKFKDIKIWSIDYLTQYYVMQLGITKYSTNFSDKKASLEGLIIVEEDKLYGVIDATKSNTKKKEYVLEAKYEEIEYLPATKHFLVKSNGKYGTVTRDKTIKIKTVYDEIKIMDNEKGLYLVKQNNAYGVVNTEGEVIITPEYKQIGIDISKYISNGVENKYILLDEIIPIMNSEGLWGFFNIKGEKITNFKYTGVGCKSTPASNSYPALIIPSDKIIVVQKDKHYNLMNVAGEELVPMDILDSVYFKTNTVSDESEFFMTSINNTKVIKVKDWLTSIGR